MKSFTEISPAQMDENIFKLIGSDWMLVTAQKPDGSFNTMTASWGGAGVLWNKNVVFCFIRPQRYTFSFAESTNALTFSFFDESCRDALRICGSKSGRQIDKCEATGLKPVRERDYVWFEQARLVLQCRILYKDDLKKSCFLDDSLLSNYQEIDYHRMYVCEIEHVRKAVDDKS